MGLDISVMQPVEPTAENIKASEDWQTGIYEYIISNDEGSSELAVFTDFLFKKTIVYNDFEATFKALGFDLDKYNLVSYGAYRLDEEKDDSDDNLCVAYKFRLIDGEDEIRLIESDIKTFEKERDCLLVTEVGYQRKGANQKFYEDGMWGGSPCVLDKATLNEHLEKYFSAPTPESKGGWGSGTEIVRTADEMRENFQRNIIDKFVEGKTFVIYH